MSRERRAVSGRTEWRLLGGREPRAGIRIVVDSGDGEVLRMIEEAAGRHGLELIREKEDDGGAS